MAFVPSPMQLLSTAFSPHELMQKKYTGEGENVSPPLRWTDLPEGTRSLAVICHDPDAPLVQNGSYGYVHWVLYNIPADAGSLAEGVAGHTQGLNDSGKPGYTGPMPPQGHGNHHYFFWLLALDADLGLSPGLTLAGLLERVEPHLLGMNRLVGVYRRA